MVRSLLIKSNAPSGSIGARANTTSSMISETMRLTIMTGFLGGLTTYSSFNYETTRFFQDRAWGAGALYVGATLVGCYVAGLTGLGLAKALVDR